jgi:hypothetical protein
MLGEWEAQNIFNRSITKDILGLLTMDQQWTWFTVLYQNNTLVGISHFLYGF